MKCPNCGTSNGKTNKFCRSCGFGLFVAAAQDAPLEESLTPEPEDVELGERLFSLMQLLETAEIDDAIEKGREIKEQFPDSTSAHSIMALIYERKAESAIHSDDIEEGRDFYRLAMSEVERVIDLNPDSPADREKLANIRLKLTGGAGRGAAQAPVRASRHIKDILVALPPPVQAAAGVFVVLMALGMLLIPGARRERSRVAAAPSSLRTPSSPPAGQPGPPSEAPNEPSPDALSTYTFTAPGPTTTSHPEQPQRQSQEAPAANGDEVPPVTISERYSPLTLAPKKPAKSQKSEKPKSASEEQASENAASQDKTPEKATGSSMLALALQYHDQGMDDDAARALNQAKTLFQADVDAGKNVVSSKRGIDLATKYAGIWGQSKESTEEQ